MRVQVVDLTHVRLVKGFLWWKRSADVFFRQDPRTRTGGMSWLWADDDEELPEKLRWLVRHAVERAEKRASTEQIDAKFVKSRGLTVARALTTGHGPR